MPSPVDVSAMFWRFVHAVLELPYDDLTATPEFTWLSDVKETSTLLLMSDTAACLPAEKVVTALTVYDMATRGIRWDQDRGVYVFNDVHALFAGLLELFELLLIHQPEIVDTERVDLLRRCVRKMAQTVSVYELADELHDLDSGCSAQPGSAYIG